MCKVFRQVSGSVRGLNGLQVPLYKHFMSVLSPSELRSVCKFFRHTISGLIGDFFGSFRPEHRSQPRSPAIPS